MDEKKLADRIIVDPRILGGRPVIGNRTLSVEQVLGMLSAGDTPEMLLKKYPSLEREDIQACLVFAHRLAGSERNQGGNRDPGLGSPTAILAAIENSPKVPIEWVKELEQLIRQGEQPPIQRDPFEDAATRREAS